MNFTKKSNFFQKVKPATCIPKNILNVLTAYSWVSRIFNGDFTDNFAEVSEGLLSLSPVLSSGANYEEAVLAIDSVKVHAENVSY